MSKEEEKREEGRRGKEKGEGIVGEGTWKREGREREVVYI